MTNNAARNQVFSQLEAQRHVVSYAARPAVTPAQIAQDIAQRMRDAIKANDLPRARELAIELRPMLGLLPEGN